MLDLHTVLDRILTAKHIPPTPTMEHAQLRRVKNSLSFFRVMNIVKYNEERSKEKAERKGNNPWLNNTLDIFH